MEEQERQDNIEKLSINFPEKYLIYKTVSKMTHIFRTIDVTSKTLMLVIQSLKGFYTKTMLREISHFLETVVSIVKKITIVDYFIQESSMLMTSYCLTSSSQFCESLIESILVSENSSLFFHIVLIFI